MHDLVEQFCAAWETWDRRSGGGIIYLETVMRYLGGSVAGAQSAERQAGELSQSPLLQYDKERSYEVDDMRQTLHYLVGRVGVNAGFLISSIIRIVTAQLELTHDAYRERIESMPSADQVQDLFQRYSDSGTLPPNAVRALGDLAGNLETRLAALPGRGGKQFPFEAWREIMLPLLESDSVNAELYEEWDEDDL